jgi:hypothetical protein
MVPKALVAEAQEEATLAAGDVVANAEPVLQCYWHHLHITKHISHKVGWLLTSELSLGRFSVKSQISNILCRRRRHV